MIAHTEPQLRSAATSTVISGRSLLLQRKCACGGSSGLTANCSQCEKKKLVGQPLQTKLRINEPGDEYEQEADRVAEQVMRMRDSELNAGYSPLHGMPLVQRTVVDSQTGIGEVPDSVQRVLSSSGQTLDADTRAFFEPRFGHDFGNVRIHSDAAAEQSAHEVSARAYTVGNDIVFGAGGPAPRTHEGQRLIAHELTHVVQQGVGNKMTSALQRSPVFPDDSCDSEKVEAKITDYVAIALDLVKRAVTSLSNPEEVAGPLRRFFHVDLTKPGHVGIALPILRDNLAKLQTVLEGPVNSYCETRPEYRTRTRDDEERGSRSRAFTRRDKETKRIILAEGVTYNRNIFRVTGLTIQRQVVNTIIHEYSHLAQIGHGELDPADFSNEHSTKVRGLTMFEALNNAESYLRFVRAVTSAPRSTDSLKQPAPEPGAGSDCGSLDQLLPPRFPQAEVEDRPDLEAYFPRLQGKCFRLLRGGDDSCFGYCLHRAAGGDALSKGANIAIPPTIEEFDSAFAQYYEPIELDAVDAANPPGDAVLALFARGNTPAHTACRSDIEYEGAYLWESKVSPVFPLILHHLSDLEGGAAGDVVRLYKRRAVQEP